MNTFKCQFKDCIRYNTKDCSECTNNIMRNYVHDYFSKSKDNKKDNLKMKNNMYVARFVGPNSEQGGLLCPVCEHTQNMYVFKGTCLSCGAPLTSE